MANDESRERVFKARVARERAAAGERRIRFSKWVRQEAVELLVASGAKRGEFAKEMGLATTSVQRWLRAVDAKKGPRYEARGFRRMSVEGHTGAGQLELVFPSGARLIGLSWQQVRELLGASR
jgi:transposase-like protein